MSDRTIEFLDGAMPAEDVPLLTIEEVYAVLREARRIAVIGASSNPWRASNSVMRYLVDHGYECVPVNPNERMVLGQPCFPSLEAAVAGSGGQPFDIVDVFRRPEFTPDIARSAVATGCGTLWLQQLVINWEAARIAHDAGLGVVMDWCSAVVHRRMLTSPDS